MLALAVLVFCNDARNPLSVTLFPGTNSKDRFANILSVIVQQLSDEDLVVLGCTRKDIAPYSARKGSATYANGQIMGPNPVSVQLRMGHSLGKVNDPYLHFSDPQDQLCGRLVALLPILSAEFGTLPPHFNEHVIKNILTVEFWKQIVPGYEQLPVEFQPTLPYLLASIIFHEDFLRKELHGLHPIFSSRVFSANPELDVLRKSVLVGSNFCENTGMQASGVPAHVLHEQKLQNLEKKLEDVKNCVVNKLDDMKETIVQNVSGEVVQGIKSNFVVEGVIPLSVQDLQSLEVRIGKSIEMTVNNKIDEFLVTYNANSSQLPTSGMRGVGEDTSNVNSRWWGKWDWEDGKLPHPVPKSWRFPSRINVKRLWDLWNFGHIGDGIRPLKFISRNIDILERSDKKLHSMARCVIAKLSEYITDPENKITFPAGIQKIKDLNQVQSDEVFSRAFKPFIDRLYKAVSADCNRYEDVCFGTIYNRIQAYNKQQ